MCVEFRPFEPADLEELTAREEYEPTRIVAASMGDQLQAVANKYAWTAWDSYGRARASCGICNAEAWAFLAPDLTAGETVAITKKVHRVLLLHSLNKGEVGARVRKDVPAAVRWVEALRFEEAGDIDDYFSWWVFN